MCQYCHHDTCGVLLMSVNAGSTTVVMMSVAWPALWRITWFCQCVLPMSVNAGPNTVVMMPVACYLCLSMLALTLLSWGLWCATYVCQCWLWHCCHEACGVLPMSVLALTLLSWCLWHVIFVCQCWLWHCCHEACGVLPMSFNAGSNTVVMTPVVWSVSVVCRLCLSVLAITLLSWQQTPAVWPVAVACHLHLRWL